MKKLVVIGSMIALLSATYGFSQMGTPKALKELANPCPPRLTNSCPTAA
jgi:hypothetical protein